METTIRLKPSELNTQLFDMVKMLVEREGFKEISISLSSGQPQKRLRRESSAGVEKKIADAIHEINSGDTAHFVSFTAEEFEQFSQSLSKK